MRKQLGLLARYSDVSTDLNDARDCRAKERASALLSHARRLYLDHVRNHGCGKTVWVNASRDCDSVEEQLRADVVGAQLLLEQAWGTLTELSCSSTESGVTSDGTVTLAEAKQLWADAQKRYTIALRRFSDFMVRGKLPEAS